MYNTEIKICRKPFHCGCSSSLHIRKQPSGSYVQSSPVSHSHWEFELLYELLSLAEEQHLNLAWPARQASLERTETWKGQEKHFGNCFHLIKHMNSISPKGINALFIFIYMSSQFKLIHASCIKPPVYKMHCTLISMSSYYSSINQ